ncbi:ActS/PrrB/RegB family redox-sensitive histidine kinase [Paroceanicella profunda]|uniref:histidine kinase n=1 Tax=Paroceanicella profunda TaxID=2579971 RepID=A0A5B8FYN4_9RHOB|nr:ActS/PrrB/RegB family redox-sensitive histidine kinase [Paroceanicella profunda]QDL91779.1 ActS/PrrB/RegB family redox-sensitive histidine kinase [Paroceanicella profunda]
MQEAGLSLMTNAARSDWVRLRTLTLLRWLAIGGQTMAVVVASQWFDVALPLDLCGFAIAASAAFNIISTVVHPQNKRLSERDTALILLFDLTQLALLLFLSGGLTNPFCVLVLAPVTISATALTLRVTLLLGLAALADISLLALFHLPLAFDDGTDMILPSLHIGGTWAALLIGIIFLALYARRVTIETFTMSQALIATQMALSREQRLTALGGLVAAAAHELGTPLATIKLASSELAHELKDRPDLLEDVRLIRAQTDRCRDILRGLGRAGKDDAHLRHAPIAAVVEEAAEPHVDRGRDVIVRLEGEVDDDSPAAPDQPEINRRPEVVHGLRNLIQNAVDFSRGHVWIDIDWDDANIRIAVGDDGPGYPADVIGRLGDPFVRRRSGQPQPGIERPEYEGMGLGLFIAKTLLERSGARIAFANGSEHAGAAGLPPGADPEHARPPGAIVEVIWPRAVLEVTREESRAALGSNRPFDLSNI